MQSSKIIPSLWFHANSGIDTVIGYYQSIFGKDFSAGKVITIGTTPSGHTELCEVKIFGQPYSMMSTAQAHHPFNDAIAFTLYCVDQDEIDRYWAALTKEGEEVQCGWCKDKFGLRWQILPHNMAVLMAKKDAFAVIQRQKKIVIADF